MKNMTYVNAIEAALSIIRNVENGNAIPQTFTEGEASYTIGEVKERLSALEAQLVKRNSSNAGKPTKAQKENADIKATLLDVMSNGEAHTITEWQDMDEALSALSNQKVSALMRQLVTDGKVVKTVDKRKALFAVVQG